MKPYEARLLQAVGTVADLTLAPHRHRRDHFPIDKG